MSDEKPLHVRVGEAIGHVFAFGEGMDLDSALGSVWAGCPRYDTDWSATGPLIERFKIGVRWHNDAEDELHWEAVTANDEHIACGEADSPLSAVCCLILSLHADGRI